MRIPEFAAHLFFKRRHLTRHFIVKRFRPPAVHVSTTRIGTNGETMWYRQLQHTHHLSKVCTFTAQQIFQLHWWATMFVVEGKNVRHEKSLGVYGEQM